MSTFKEIRGKLIKSVSSDPANASAGEMWYNSTSLKLKGVIASGAWSSTSPMSSPRATMAGGGTNTSAITTGKNGANPSDAALAESYNGTGWANETNVPTALGYASGTGSSSEEYVQIGGGYPSKTGTVLDYDGSSWTSATAVPGGGPGYIETGAAGPAADALVAGGNNGLTTTWERGSGSWTSGGAMASGVYAATLVGTKAAAISMGGVTYPGGYKDYNQDYNGTAWTSLTVLPSIRGYSGGAGIQTLAMIIGGGVPGSPGILAACIEWDGSSWTSTPSLGTARNTMCPMGKTVGTAVAAPGNTAPAGTEEYNFTANTVTAAAWASGNAMNTTRRYLAGLGTRPAALAAGGSTSSPGLNETANSEEYDGTSWTEGDNLNTARVGLGGAGIQTSAIAAGGRTPGNVEEVAAEEYNGTSWTATPNLNTGRRYVAGFGASETAAVVAGGTVGGAPGAGTVQTATEEYNGSSWTAVNSMNTGKNSTGGNSCGVETAGLFITVDQGVEEYNGSTWSEQNDLNRPPGDGGGVSGAQTAAVYAGGAGYLAFCESYDGTSFVTSASLSTGRAYSGGAGATSATGTIFGGKNSPSSPRTTGATEEFTAETTSANIVTVTTS